MPLYFMGVTFAVTLCDKRLTFSSCAKEKLRKMAGVGEMEQSAHPVPTETTTAFDRYGPEMPTSPVIISVPHAGRYYAPDLLANARVTQGALSRLEDRHADRLVDPLIAAGFCTVIARPARACIDLNRDERDIDPAMLRGVPHGKALMASAKQRGGLGLIPRRLPGYGDLWLRPWEWSDIETRIETIHRPYHAMLASLMERARDCLGHAILLDVHSMPPLPGQQGVATPRIVLGDRFGQSASTRLQALAAAICSGRGIPTAQNTPYAGGHLIERHGKPQMALHALQVEIDRSLYLDSRLQEAGAGLAAMRDLIAALAQALARELPRSSFALAAE